MNTEAHTARVTLNWRDYDALSKSPNLWRKLSRVIEKKDVDSNELGPYLGTPVSILPQMFELAELCKQDHLLDIGCGDGRILIEAVKSFDCNATGIESNPRLVEIATEKINAEGLQEKIKIISGDARKAPLNDYTLVFLFLPISSLRVLLPELLKQAKLNNRIIAHEQRRPKKLPQEKFSKLLVSDEAITVAHVW